MLNSRFTIFYSQLTINHSKKLRGGIFENQYIREGILGIMPILDTDRIFQILMIGRLDFITNLNRDLCLLEQD